MEIMALNQVGTIYLDLEKSKEAIDFYGKSLEIVREIDDLSSACQALGEMGNAFVISDDFRNAANAFKECSDLAKKINDPRKEGIALYNLATALRELGHQQETSVQIDRALAILDEIEYEKIEQLREYARKFQAK